MKVCLVVPVYNEEARLAKGINQVIQARDAWNEFELEIVIADNGSSDKTPIIAAEICSSFGLLKYKRFDSPGRGNALKQVWENGDADIVAYMDVDISTDLTFFPHLLAPLFNGEADICIGSRLLISEWTERGLKREIISRVYNQILRLLFSVSFTDSQCGFKALTRRAAQTLLPIVEDGHWFFDTELLVLAQYSGFRIHDLPVRWRDCRGSKVRMLSTIYKDLIGMRRLKARLAALGLAEGSLVDCKKHSFCETDSIR
jgi:glycosyltransferase involved in cell wall biosynthesis